MFFALLVFGNRVWQGLRPGACRGCFPKPVVNAACPAHAGLAHGAFDDGGSNQRAVTQGICAENAASSREGRTDGGEWPSRTAPISLYQLPHSSLAQFADLTVQDASCEFHRRMAADSLTDQRNGPLPHAQTRR